MSTETAPETLEFQTEVTQLLKLMIHSLYSNREIFLRELISNASDACDKLRFEALADDSLYAGDNELRIRVDFDAEAGTISVRDNGIGMTREDVVANIGTIAKSGTRQFLESLTGDQARDAQLIGQFGVGFYSSFIVAERVSLNTRRAGAPPDSGVSWSSDGTGSYRIETIERETHGTEVVLHLKDDAREFLDGWKLRGIIKKYSDHIVFPVRMREQAAKEEAEGEVGEETVNAASALWARPRKEIEESEYKEFYKHLSHDFEDPLAWAHNRVEGKLEYTTLLYIPSRAPFDIWDRDHVHGIKLYVRRVFIMDDAAELMPRYLRFVRGLVDSADLPLNISREILQSNRVIDTIRSASVKKVLGLLQDLAREHPDRYRTFWEQFGNVLKEGPAEDQANRDAVARLLRFASTHGDEPEQSVSLEDYVSRMADGQDRIYYVTADTFNAARNSPHLERLRADGVEVLLMYDRIDEWMMSFLDEFDGHKFASVAKGDLDLGESGAEEAKTAAAEARSLIERIREALGDRVSEVRVSTRLTTSPACLVFKEHELALHMQALMKQAGQAGPQSTPTLEVDPRHVLLRRMEAEQDPGRFGDWASILFDQAVLAQGGQLDDPAGFVKRLNAIVLTLDET